MRLTRSWGISFIFLCVTPAFVVCENQFQLFGERFFVFFPWFCLFGLFVAFLGHHRAARARNNPFSCVLLVPLLRFLVEFCRSSISVVFFDVFSAVFLGSGLLLQPNTLGSCALLASWCSCVAPHAFLVVFGVFLVLFCLVVFRVVGRFLVPMFGHPPFRIFKFL